MPRISSKNQVTIPLTALEEARMHAGDPVSIEVLGDGELRVRREDSTYEDAFGVLTGLYPPGYLAELDREDDAR